MGQKILVIDDDQELNRLLTSYLARFDFEVISAINPEVGLSLFKSENPALIVLDVMLPGKNGFKVCEEIRQQSAIPIIMLTARGELSDRVVGLEMGADDYMPKPYEPRELVARIQSVLRRHSGKVVTGSMILKSEDLLVNHGRASAELSGQDLELTSSEFSVLWYLMENSDRTLSREAIFSHLRGGSWDGLDRSVDMILSRLRLKLKDSTKQSKYIKTMWGDGYRFVGKISREQN